MTDPNFERWALRDIRVPERLTKPGDDAQINALARSIEKTGHLINPLLIRPDGTLIAGYDRWLACQRIPRLRVEVQIVRVSDAEAELLEIDENLCRKELSLGEREHLTYRRQALYEAVHAAPKGGRPRKTRDTVSRVSPAKGFTRETSERSGQSQRTVQRDAKIGAAFDREELQLMDEQGIGVKERARLASRPPEERHRAIDELKAAGRPGLEALLSDAPPNPLAFPCLDPGEAALLNEASQDEDRSRDEEVSHTVAIALRRWNPDPERLAALLWQTLPRETVSGLASLLQQAEAAA